MALRQPEQRPDDTAVDFWARAFASDFRRHGRRRSLSEIAREAGVPLRTLQRYLVAPTLPRRKDILSRVATVMGVEHAEVLSFYRRRAASANRDTARELSSVGAAA